MSDPRLQRLVAELTADRAYATGRRAFPRTVSVDDALAIVGEVHLTMDDGAAARADAAQKLGRPLACARGCSGCCEELVMVFRAEALRVARWLERPENAAVRQRFLEAYPTWRDRVGDGPRRVADAFSSGDEAAHLALHVEQWQKRVLCAFNQDGACTIYPVRPLLCRNAHAVETSAYCTAGHPSGRTPTRLRSDELDAWVEQARGLLRALHHAIGGPRQRQAALCEAVHELLPPVER